MASTVEVARTYHEASENRDVAALLEILHPASLFVGRMVAIQTAPGIRYTLRGRELVSTRPVRPGGVR